MFDRGQIEDIDLVKAAASGDAASFERLVGRHEASVYRFIRTLTHDASAEDALQETFLAAWRGASGFRADSSVRSWLFTIARHAVHRQFRRHVGEPDVDDQTPLDALGVQAGWGATDNPEQAAARAEEGDAVRRALDALEPEDRRVLVLRDLEQLSGEEAAGVLGLTLPALKSRLHRARLRFAAQFRQETVDGH